MPLKSGWESAVRPALTGAEEAFSSAVAKPATRNAAVTAQTMQYLMGPICSFPESCIIPGRQKQWSARVLQALPLSPRRISSIDIVQPQEPQTSPCGAIHNRQHRNLRGPVFHETQRIQQAGLRTD